MASGRFGSGAGAGMLTHASQKHVASHAGRGAVASSRYAAYISSLICRHLPSTDPRDLCRHVDASSECDQSMRNTSLYVRPVRKDL